MKNSTLCPTCNKQSDLSTSNSFRPFCSERCRLIDFGQWAEEKYTISEPIISDDDDNPFSDLQKH